MAVPDLLLRLLRTPAPSGSEGAVAAVVREALEGVAEVTVDRLGNAVATVGRDGPLLALVAHADEIGLVVTHADERGFLAVRAVGGWSAEVAAGQRVEILSRGGRVPGVVARSSLRSRSGDVPRVRWEDLHVDVGARNRTEALALVRVGDRAVVAGEPVELANGRIASRSLDNRASVYVAVEALRQVAALDIPCRVALVASSLEEIGRHGAVAAAYGLAPDAAIALDVTHASDWPGEDPRTDGDTPLGGGVVVTRGASIDETLVERLLELAERDGIPATVEVNARQTNTDLDAIVVVGRGIPSALLSMPLRHMHSPVEVVDVADLEAVVRLVVAFARDFDGAGAR